MLTHVRFCLVASCVGVALVWACGGDDTGSSSSAPPPSPGEALCQQIADYAKQCGASAGPCDQALVADCSKVVGLLSDAFIKAVSDCLSANTGESPTSCMTSALASLSPDASE